MKMNIVFAILFILLLVGYFMAKERELTKVKEKLAAQPTYNLDEPTLRDLELRYLRGQRMVDVGLNSWMGKRAELEPLLVETGWVVWGLVIDDAGTVIVLRKDGFRPIHVGILTPNNYILDILRRVKE